MNTVLSPKQLVELAKEVVGRGGLLTFRASGHSMAPLIADADTVILGPLKNGKVSLGDIVLVDCPGGPRLHRVVLIGPGRDDQYIITRGDQMSAGQEKVKAEAIFGRVVRVHRPWRRWLSFKFICRIIRYYLFSNG
jgi:hypothetical protein